MKELAAKSCTEGEAVIRVERAIRAKQFELACMIAMTWDTLSSPGDVRLLTGKHITCRGPGNHKKLIFDRTEDERIKTGRAALDTVSACTQRLCEEAWKWRAVEMMPGAYAFRKTDGKPWKDHELAKALASIHDPNDGRQLPDMSRSGSGEADASGMSNPGLLSTKLANSIQTPNALHETYASADVDAVIECDKARLAGRARRRAGNDS